MSEFSKLLAEARTIAINGTLTRAVAAECLYFSESEATALMEYRRQFLGLKYGTNQPVTLFFARVCLQCVLDLANEQTREVFGVKRNELEISWGCGLPPTTTQRLGDAVVTQRKISAIRYPSVAAIKNGTNGFNIVIYKFNVRAPDFVHILGPTKEPIQKLS